MRGEVAEGLAHDCLMHFRDLATHGSRPFGAEGFRELAESAGQT